MSNPHLPLEIQRMILDHAFDQLGFEACAPLRRVNQFFDRELLIIFTQKEALQGWTSLCTSRSGESIKLFMARYLMVQRPLRLSQPDGGFASLLHYVLDEIERLEEQESSVQSRYSLIYDLCGQITPWQVVYQSQFRTSEAIPLDHLCYHTLAAAVCLGKRKAVSALLKDPDVPLDIISHRLIGSPMSAAIKTQKLDIARRLLDRGADANGRDYHNGYVLELAIKSRCLEIVHLVLEPQYACLTDGGTYEHAIIIAIRDFPLAAPVLLQRCSANLPGMSSVLRYGLWHACYSGLLEAVHILMKHVDHRMIREYSAGWWTPLEYAAWKGHIDIVHHLVSERHHLEYPEDSNDAFSDCSIMAATYEGNSDIAILLLEAGVHIHDHGRNLFEAAAPRPESVGLIRTLLERGDIDACPSGSVSNGDHRQVPWILLACRYGNTEFLELLAQYGVDIVEHSKRDRRPTHSPIAIAKAFAQSKVVRLLLALGVEDEALPEDFSKETIVGDHRSEVWLSQQDLLESSPSFKGRRSYLH